MLQYSTPFIFKKNMKKEFGFFGKQLRTLAKANEAVESAMKMAKPSGLRSKTSQAHSAFAGLNTRSEVVKPKPAKPKPNNNGGNVSVNDMDSPNMMTGDVWFDAGLSVGRKIKSKKGKAKNSK